MNKMYQELIDVIVRHAPKEDDEDFGEKFKDYVVTLTRFAMRSLTLVGAVLDIEPDTTAFNLFIEAIEQYLREELRKDK